MNKHTFEANDKGLLWLVFITLAITGISVFLVYLVVRGLMHGMEIGARDVIELGILAVFAPVMVMCLYLDWKTYLYASDTTLVVDMQSRTLTYKHAGKKIEFKGLDVEHWYCETGMFCSRVAANHTVMVLRTGEVLFVPCWLFEGEKFFLSDITKYNACYFIRDKRTELLIPECKSAPRRYDYLFPDKLLESVNN